MGGQWMEVPNCVFCQHFARLSSPINTPRNCHCLLHGRFLPIDRHSLCLCRDWRFREVAWQEASQEKWRSYVERLPPGTLECFQSSYDDFCDRLRIPLVQLEPFP